MTPPWELVLVYGKDRSQASSFFQMDTQVTQYHLVTRPFSPSCTAVLLTRFWYKATDLICVGLFLASILFHSTISLSLYEYHALLTTI